MRYNEPYGGAANAPYVNGDPSIGRAGSIPPAASIEYPQREIVAVISNANLATPDNADLQQLARAIQSHLMNSRDDVGTANAYQVTLAPAPTAYYKYLTVVMKVTNTNTGASTINVNALGAKNIVHVDLSAIIAGELVAGQMVCLVYDGTQFQLVWRSSVAGAPVFLTAPRTFYVNSSTGSDANDGTAATTGGGHGPWATLQKAMNVIVTYNLNGYDITVNVANGNYPGGLILKQLGGSGTVNWIGNSTTPANVHINTTNKTSLQGTDIGKSHVMNGFKFSATNGGSPTDEMAGIIVQGNTTLGLLNTEFGSCVDAQVKVVNGARVRFGGIIRLAGSALSFITCFQNSTVDQYSVSPSDIVMTVVGSITYGTAFIWAYMLGSVSLTYLSFTNAAGVTSATRYRVEMNAVINTSGGGVNYWPGTTAGTTATGGQYV